MKINVEHQLQHPSTSTSIKNHPKIHVNNLFTIHFNSYLPSIHQAFPCDRQPFCDLRRACQVDFFANLEGAPDLQAMFVSENLGDFCWDCLGGDFLRGFQQQQRQQQQQQQEQQEQQQQQQQQEQQEQQQQEQEQQQQQQQQKKTRTTTTERNNLNTTT